MYTELLLFLGALGDSLIGPNFIIPGEPIFFAAGYQLHLGNGLAVFVAIFGGLLGGQLSYYLGHRYGYTLEKRLLRSYQKPRRLIARSRCLLNRYMVRILIFARLLGPVAWVVPFMAGRNKVEWKKFSGYSFIGLLLGAGQFIIWGYLLAMGIEGSFFEEHSVFFEEFKLTLLLLASVVVFYWLGKKKSWRYLKLKTISLLICGLLIKNYSHFFLLPTQSEELVNHQQVEPVDIEQLEFKVFPGKSSIFPAQAANVIYLGDSPEEMMHQLGWIRNKTFSRDNIGFHDYIDLMKSGTPPVSDLYFDGVPQHMAFQEAGSLLQRNHIRWWQVGIDSETNAPIWVGAISYDNGLAVKLYAGIITILHSIDANVDQQRDLLANSIQNMGEWQVRLEHLIAPVTKDIAHDYFSDGKILTITGLISL